MNSYIRAVLNCRNSALDSKPFTGESRERRGHLSADVSKEWTRIWMYLTWHLQSQSPPHPEAPGTSGCQLKACAGADPSLQKASTLFLYASGGPQTPRSGLCSPSSTRTWRSHECNLLLVEPCRVFPSARLSARLTAWAWRHHLDSLLLSVNSLAWYAAIQFLLLFFLSLNIQQSLLHVCVSIIFNPRFSSSRWPAGGAGPPATLHHTWPKCQVVTSVDALWLALSLEQGCRNGTPPRLATNTIPLQTRDN